MRKKNQQKYYGDWALAVEHQEIQKSVFDLSFKRKNNEVKVNSGAVT